VSLSRRLVLPTLGSTAVLVLLLALRTLPAARSFAIWFLLLAAGVLLALVRDVGHRDGTPRAGRFEAALRRHPRRPVTPAELVRMERELELGIASADNAHRRLLPLLRAAAAARLASGHGIDFSRQPDAARELLGEETWNVLRPDRPAPEDRHAPGLPRSVVVATIERIEAL